MSADEPAVEETPQLPDLLPVLPLRDMVLFPFIILPLSVAREKSIQAVDRSLAENRLLMLVAQKDPATEEPTPEDLFDVGTVASITRMLKLPDGRIRFHCLERQEGSFVRQVDVFEPVNFTGATARLERGLLCIELPRVEDRRRRHFDLTIEEKAEE